MKTRIGSNRLISGKKSSPALNRSLTSAAQKRIDQVVDRANDRHANALAVDGVEFLLWRKQTAGGFCTCHGQDQRDTSVAVIQGNEEKTRNSIDDLKADSNVKFGVISMRDDRQAEEEASGDTIYRIVDGDSLENIYEERDDEFDSAHEFGDAMEDEYLAAFAEMQSPDEQARLNRSATALLLGGKNTPCGICFSTGWREGYQLQNGKRYVFDAVNVETAGGFTIDTSQLPNLFVGSPGQAAVEFVVDLPKYFRKALIIRAMKNLMLAVGIKVEVQWPGTSEWVPFTVSGINLRKGQTNTGTRLRVFVDPETPPSFQTYFSHIEVVIEYTVRPVGQMPNIDSTETFELIEATTQTNIEWPARIGNLDFGSIAVDSKYRRAWRIISVTPQRTAKGQVFAIETQAQKLQLFEPVALLNLFRDRYVILKNYKGLGTQ